MGEDKKLVELYELYKLSEPINDWLNKNRDAGYEIHIAANTIKILKREDDLIIKKRGTID